ncbi:hypothetical protein NBRC116593_18700 [Sulfitobacter pacificus]
MGYNNSPGVLIPFVKDLHALMSKGPIADRGHLIHQIGVKWNSHRNTKGKPRFHSCGIGPQRHAEMTTQFREFLNKINQTVTVNAIQSGNETRVLHPRQIWMKRSLKTNGIRNTAR